LERDFNLPPLETLLGEVEVIRRLQRKWHTQTGDIGKLGRDGTDG
jgi:uncharacterized protein (UPF0276 family)